MAIDGGLALLNRLTGWNVSKQVFIWIMMVGIFIAGYQAWSGEHAKVVQMEEDTKASALVGIVKVDKNGTTLDTKNFDKYGLFVKKIEFSGEPAYQLTFEKEPDDFDVITRESLNREMVPTGPRTYRVRFTYTGGFGGSSAQECSFIVKAFSINK